MKKIVILGANEFQLPLILKAKEMGYETHVFAWLDGAVAKDKADFFYPVSIAEKDLILEKCKEIKPDGVISIGSDFAVLTYSYVSEKLGLCTNPYEIADKCTNKYRMRQAFENSNVSVPKFTSVKEGEIPDITGFDFPLIVKPTDRSGSRGVTKILSGDELTNAVNRACEYSFEKKAVIEEFIEGNEYSCECISYNGEHHLLALTKKFTTGAPNFIETGHIQPADIPDTLLPKVKEEVFKGLNALGIKFGASHTEFKIDEKGKIGIIEIGARMGGDCIGSDLVYLSTGYDFLKMVIDVACGKKPDIIKTGGEHTAQIKFLFNRDDLDELEKTKKEKPESIYRISDIAYENSGHITDSSNRLGYYITFN